MVGDIYIYIIIHIGRIYHKYTTSILPIEGFKKYPESSSVFKLLLDFLYPVYSWNWDISFKLYPSVFKNYPVILRILGFQIAPHLVGGWTYPFLETSPIEPVSSWWFQPIWTNISQNVSSRKVGVKIKHILKPPPRFSWTSQGNSNNPLEHTSGTRTPIMIRDFQTIKRWVFRVQCIFQGYVGVFLEQNTSKQTNKHLTHGKNILLSMKYWLFNKDAYLGLL